MWEFMKHIIPFLAILFCATSALAQPEKERVIGLLNDTLSKDPKNSEILMMRGLAFAEDKDYNNAIIDLSASLAYLPEFRLRGQQPHFFGNKPLDSTDIIRFRAYCYDQADSLERAIADYRYLQSRQPDEFFVSIAIARMLIHREMFAEAQQEIDRIKKNSGTNERGMVYQAILFYESKKYPEALDAVNAALRKHDASVEGLMTKGKILIKLNRKPEACKYLKDAGAAMNLNYFRGEAGYLREFEKDITDLMGVNCK